MFLYKQYDQAGLDREYNNRLHVPDFADYFERWELLSRQTEKDLQIIKDISYGTLPRETLDVFTSLRPQSKTLVFIHGGYWQMLDKSMFHFIANSFHSYGINTVLINYPLAPKASLNQIVASCRNAMNWVYNNISAYNGDSHQIFVAGHSAGGHLAAMLMATNWKVIDPQLPVDLIKGTCVMSGLFNLVPIHLSYLNSVLCWDLQTSLRNSPLNHEPLNRCPLVISVGGDETSEFKGQSKDLYTAWKEATETELLGLAGLHHFSIVDQFSEENSSLNLAMRKLLDVL
ncbi:MAG: alpha/beta hydrolase [Segetibacter sp.]